jgi:histidinol-phosphate aminotransferase
MHPLIAPAPAPAGSARPRPDFGLDPARGRAAIAEHRPDVVFLTSPNNPTGTALAPEVISRAAQAAPGMVVVDEAYAEFARPGTPERAAAAAGRTPRLVVTRTMSKAFAFAGGRLGYLAADPAVVDAVQLVRLPYHLSALTQAAARAALAHTDALLGHVDALKQQRDRIVADAARLGLRGRRQRRQLRAVRVGGDQQAPGSAARPRRADPRRRPAGWLRVTAGTPAETDAFLGRD